MANDNLGQILFANGLKQTTWFSDDGKSVSHGIFNPGERLFDAGGTGISGALHRRMGMPPGLTDFQPGFGHAQRSALFAGMVQRALDRGYFVQFGIAPGPRVDGATIGSGFNPELLADAAFLLTAARGDSEIVRFFADVQPVPVDPVSVDASIEELVATKKRPWRFNPAGQVHTPKALGQLGAPLTAADRFAWYQLAAQKLAGLGDVDLVSETCSIDPETFKSLFLGGGTGTK